MGNAPKIIEGGKYNRWTVLSIFSSDPAKCKCICSCGTIRDVNKSGLRRGKTKSCGCHKYEVEHSKNKNSYHEFYLVYRTIKKRCYSKTNKSYQWYGARGITMCDEWLNDSGLFFKWCYENGYRAGLNIDRKDNDLGYSPSNCRVVTPKQNQRNRRNNRLVEYKGETKCLSEWCEIYGLNRHSILKRLRSNCPIEFLFSKSRLNYKLLHHGNNN